MTWLIALAAVVANLVGSSVDGNDRTCEFRCYRGHSHWLTVPAARQCPPSIQAEH